LDCSFKLTMMNESQVSQKIIHHLHEDHGMKVIPAAFMIKIKHSIIDQNIIEIVNQASNEILVYSLFQTGSGTLPERECKALFSQTKV
jgi:predicted small metal-binding protein